MPNVKYLRTADDVTPRVLEIVEDIFDGWFANDPRIDWDYFFDKLGSYGDCEINEPFDIADMNTAAVRKIKRYVRSLQQD